MAVIVMAAYLVTLAVYAVAILFCITNGGFTRDRLLVLISLTCIHGTLALWLDLKPGLIIAGVSMGVWSFLLLEPTEEMA